MKALTIRQPWASLIVNDYKHYEFRSWKTNYRGKIFIHAGTGTDRSYLAKYTDYNLEYINGAIIGEAEITDCILVDEKFNKELRSLNHKVYTDNVGYYAWKLDNIIKYDQPIPAKGQLGLWNYKEFKTKITNL